ncbi:hypothetical protein JHK82_022453 [Glycine max]|nr:hypothetical protein JHK85_022941 [Glycine max]KAG5026556.1 hypothetical protein JHK86_022470 [Glycine max]KAG5137722.1 hypothetical protein JHK82_022453 [Glycine max]
MQQRLLLSFLCINVNNGDICCNEAHKAQLGGASGADPQFVRTWFMVQRTSGSVLREPVRMPTKALHITSRKSLCGEGFASMFFYVAMLSVVVLNMHALCIRSSFAIYLLVCKAVASLRETTGVIVKASLHKAIVYGPELG